MRRGGLLLHPTSLPGPHGIGDAGPAAREVLAFCESAGLRVWQMLPIGPPDAHGSPYASASASAISPSLISIDDLVADGWLRPDEVVELGHLEVDLETVHRHKAPMVALAASRVARSIDLDKFASRQPWTRTWAQWVTLAEAYATDWTRWEDGLRHRDADALAALPEGPQGAAIAVQWLLHEQWQHLIAEARSRGVALWGDLPILSEADGADVWERQDLWRLDAAGRPSVVSGVPPDAFTPKGQRWGHPLPHMAAHEAEGWATLRARRDLALSRFDAVRIDHFRGFCGLWEVPGDAPDARSGRWGAGLGDGALTAIVAGEPQRWIAEDLGVITPDVIALRDRHGLPGMVVLQFGFDEGSEHHPSRHRKHQVVYTGTHDNDTTAGWLTSLDAEGRRRVAAIAGHATVDDVVEMAWQALPDTAIVPVQDLLGLGSEARLNVPGQTRGNWRWRLPRRALDGPLAQRVRDSLGRAGR